MSHAVKSPQIAVRVCPFCKATGQCSKCAGCGIRTSLARGRFNQRVKLESDCNACEGTGVCQLCHGTGSLGRDGQ